jgi:hypothetical protein
VTRCRNHIGALSLVYLFHFYFLGEGVTLQRFLPVMENDRSHYLLGNWRKNGKGFRERERAEYEKNEGN